MNSTLSQNNILHFIPILVGSDFFLNFNPNIPIIFPNISIKTTYAFQSTINLI
jgi:hypothetical protein